MPVPKTRREALALAAGAASLLTAAGEAASASLEVGRVAILLGQAHRSTVGGPLALQAGAGVRQGDEIATGFDSRLELVFVDGSALTLGPDTRVVIKHYAPQDGAAQALLLLVAGIVKVTIGSGVTWQSFEVRSETAVASVRATQWIMEATPEGSAVLVLEGQVEVAALGAAVPPPSPAPSRSDESPAQPSGSGADGVVLAPGEGTDVKPGAGTTPPKVWGPARRDAALARVAIP